MNPNIRTVTDLTTIPASVVQVGTLTPFAGDVLLLEYSGTAAALDAILVQAGANKDQQKTALWVWDGTSTAPFNVTSWFGKFIKVDRDASAYTGDFNLIETKLFGWEVISTGDGTGTVAGSAIGALNTISFKPITDFFVDPVVVEGNVGDNLTVLEFYNQQAGSSSTSNGSTSVIEVDKAGFLALVAANALTFPALYKITDVENGLFVETLSENTFSPDATVSLFVPNYIADGDNLGQMDFDSIPSVAAGQYVIWGDYYWRNNTASPITPTITDDITLGGGLTQLAKQSGSIYETISFFCKLDLDLNIGYIYNAFNESFFQLPTIIIDGFPELTYLNCPLNNPSLAASNATLVRNYVGDIFNGQVMSVKYSDVTSNALISNNKGSMDISITSSSNEFSGNIGNFPTIIMVNGNRFKDNIATGGSIGYIELFDNCEAIGNEALGDGAVIWDVRTGENCKFNENILNSNATGISCGFTDIDMMQFDEVIGNELNGDDAVVQVLNMFGYSKFNNNTFNGAMSGGYLGSFCQFQLYNSEITDNTFNQDFKYWREITLHNAKLRNATDIQVQKCTFEGIDLDLTGFTTDITSQTIQSGKGWFVVTRDFDTTPLVDGIPELHNIIPIGGYITSIKAKGSITSGTSLTIGLETDDTSLISQVVANYAAGQTYNGISAVATANRSLRLASVGDLNAGSVTILVEFMI